MFVNKDAIIAAYEEVRNLASETSWLALGYDNKEIELQATGSDYAELLELFADDVRVYAYVRISTRDETNDAARFAFITWIGPSVSPLKKAKVSTDKAFVKEIMQQFGKEILADEKSEVKEEKVRKVLIAASGASYGTGK